MLTLIWLACTGTALDTADTAPAATGHAGHHAVLLDDGERPLTVEVWFPTDAPTADTDISDAFLSGDDQEAYSALLTAAPEDCPTRTATAAGAAPAPGAWPVIVASHCHNCLRLSNHTAATALAEAGFVVVAPDHAGNTLLDRLADEALPLNTDTLALRRDDLGRALDALLAGDLGVQADASRIGALGHSFGSVSVGLLAQEDDRIGAAMGIAAPMDNPLLPGVDAAALDLPLMFLVAGEDNSITEAGNILIDSNHDEAPGPAWKVEVADAGHWSFSDLCGVHEDLMPGCGTEARQTDPSQTVTYPDPAEMRQLTADLAVAFFAHTLLGLDDNIEAVADGHSLDQKL